MWKRACVVTLAALAPAVAAAETLSLKEALQRARSRAPQVLAARTELNAERAARVGATPLLGSNPSIESGAGMVALPRFQQILGEYASGPMVWVEVSVPVEIALQRRRRVGAADARAQAQAVAVEEAARQAMHAAGNAFLVALHASERLQLEETELAFIRGFRGRVAHGLEQGWASRLDLKLAQLDVERGERAVTLARAAYQRALTDLAALLGAAPPGVDRLEGPLLRAHPLPPLEEALARMGERPDVRAVRAARDAALKEANVAAAQQFPTPVIKGAYQYWNTEHALMTYVELPLPVFDRGQGEQARARARASGLSSEADALAEAARAEMRGMYDVVSMLTKARAASHEDVDPRALRDELWAHYTARRIDATTLIAAQRQTLQAQREALDLALQEALARLWIDVAMGVPP